METILFALGIAVLFWLDRDRSGRTSKALWLPTIWLLQVASRTASVWLDIDPPAAEIPGQQPAGSQFDQLVGLTLMVWGAIIVFQRRRLVMDLLKASRPVVLYFAFALFSLLWSDFAAWGFKRWARAVGELVMVLIVATDPHPITAFRRLLSRIGFVLLPASLLLIFYYPDMGQIAGYNTGVTTNKNTLGDVVYIVTLAALWQVLSLINDRNERNRGSRLLAQSILIAIGIWLLNLAQCATAVACVALGAMLMLLTSLPLFRNRPTAVHTLILGLLLFGALIKFGGGSAAITEALGRESNFTGRDRIWTIVKWLVPNRIGGAGFETFWVGPRVNAVFKMVGGPHPTTEAHNGYIEVYLNMGYLGVSLMALFLVQGYRNAVAVFRRNSPLGALLLAFVVTAVFYNISEAGFRILSPEWFCLLLSVVMANRLIGVVNDQEISAPNDFLHEPSLGTPLLVSEGAPELAWWGSPQFQAGPQNPKLIEES